MTSPDKLPMVRGITIRLGAAPRLRRRDTLAFKVDLDEKPLGRTMMPAWQRCITLSGALDLDRIEDFAQQIEECLVTDAVLAPEAGFVIEAEHGGICTRRIPDHILRGISHHVARALSRLSAA